MLNDIKPTKPAHSAKLKYVFIIAVLLGLPLAIFLVAKSSLLNVLAVGETEEPYSIFIVAGQSNAEGTNSFVNDLPEGQKIGQHPADDNANPNDNAQIWWEGADGVSVLDNWFSFFTALGNPSYTSAGWIQSDNPDTDLAGLINFKDLDENPPLGQRAKQFGPELGLARELYDKGHRKIIILKVTYGFQTLAKSNSQFVPYDWNADVANNGQPDNPARSDKSYRHLIEQYNNLTSYLNNRGDKYTVDGMFWVQGESDTLDSTYADAYEENFETLVNRSKEDFYFHPKAHFVSRKFAFRNCIDNAWPQDDNVCGFAYALKLENISIANILNLFQINPLLSIPTNTDRVRQVRGAMQTVADKYDWVDVVETDDALEDETGAAALPFWPDYVHLKAKGQLRLGKRMINMYDLPYRVPVTESLNRRNNYDGDALTNYQEDTGRGVNPVNNQPCPYIIDGVTVNTANNGNLGDDDSDCDGFPNYVDAINGPGSGITGVN